MQNREVLPLLGPVNLRRDDDRWHPRETYLSLNKGFGNVPSEKLVSLAMELESSDRPADLAVAGSAVIEAVIFSPYRADTLEQDIEIIKYGADMLERAAAGYWHDLERGFEHYDNQTAAIRAEIRAAYTPIYAALLEGDITTASREQVYTSLAYWGRYTRGLSGKFGADGLCYEIATLMGGITDEGVLLPSTPRADSGHYNDHTTHDFTFIELDEYGFIKTSTPLELKNEGDDERQLYNAGHYSPLHVVMLDANKDLGLHRDDLDTIFSQQTLTPQARRNLTTIRSGLYANIAKARREFGPEYTDTFGS